MRSGRVRPRPPTWRPLHHDEARTCQACRHTEKTRTQRRCCAEHRTHARTHTKTTRSTLDEKERPMIDYVQELLLNATQNVAWQYFQIPVADGKPTFRERAYAYELYHQLRCFASEDRAMKDLLLCGVSTKVDTGSSRKGKLPISSCTSLAR